MSPAAKRTIRTALQTLLAVATVVPLLAAAIAQADAVTDALPWLVGAASTATAVAAGLARVMALPALERILDRFGIGLVDDAEQAAE